MTQPLIEAQSLGKKFCRSLKRSLWYGLTDLGAEVLGRTTERAVLRRDEFWAVKNLSFELYPGETLGLIGPNGAGKTTLLKMLNGLLKPDEGCVTLRGRMQALIALGAGFSPVLTGRENIYVNSAILGISKAETDRRFDEIVDFAGIAESIDAPVQSYSSGMTVRLGFAIAANLQPDILLVDEVLAVGDEGFQLKCLNKIGELKAAGTAIILVSHNMHTVSTYSQRILLKTTSGDELFDDVAAGVRAYKRAVHGAIDVDIEKHCSGTADIQFFDVDIPQSNLALGDDLDVRLRYRSIVAYDDVEIDVAIRLTGEAHFHYQATNRTFGARLDLPVGHGRVDISIRDLRAIHADGWLSIAIWRHGRTEVLFWWRIPIRFVSRVRASGTNLYVTTFKAQTDRPDRQLVEEAPQTRSTA